MRGWIQRTCIVFCVSLLALVSGSFAEMPWPAWGGMWDEKTDDESIRGMLHDGSTAEDVEEWRRGALGRNFVRKTIRESPGYLEEEEMGAYIAYKRYKALEAEARAINKFRQGEIGDQNDPDMKWGTHGAVTYQAATAENIAKATRRLEQVQSEMRDVNDSWTRAGYKGTYGDLPTSHAHEAVNPVTKERIDVVAVKLRDVRRDPEKQAFQDWISKRPADLIKTINEITDAKVREELMALLEHGHPNELAHYLDIFIREKIIACEKDGRGGYMMGLNLNHPANAAAYRKMMEEWAKQLQAEKTGITNVPPEQLKPGEHRTFSSLSSNEVLGLLNCLCAASAGQSFGTYVAYNPAPSDASPACKDPGNGPCMAGNWGCWRAFIDFAAPGALQCLASFGLSTNDCDTLRALDEYNRKVEKPMRVKLVADRTTIRVGESAVVRAEISGGRPPYDCYWFAHAQNPYNSWDYGNLAMGPTVRVWSNFPNTGPQQILYVSDSYEVKGGAPGKIEVRARVMSSFYRNPHQSFDYSSCLGRSSPDYSEMYHAPISPVSEGVVITVLPEEPAEEAEEEEPAPPTKETRPPPPSKHGHTRAPPTTVPVTGVAPPPETTTTTGTGPSGPVTGVTPPKESKTPTGTKVAPVTPPETKVVPKAPGGKTPEVKKPPPPPAGGAGGGDEGKPDCQLEAGGYGTSEGDGVIFAKGSPTTRVRITIKGSDGFTQTAEGKGLAEIKRPLNPNGADEITIEDLDVPGCKETQVKQYDANGMPIMAPPTGGLAGAEPGLGSRPVTAPGQTDVLGGFVGGTEGKISEKSKGEFDTGRIFGDGQVRETKGEGDVAGAAAIRDQGGQAGLTTKGQSASATAAADSKSSWGNVMGDAVAEGVKQGASSAAGAFGSAAADQVTSKIWKPESHGPEEGEATGKGSGESGSQGVSSGTSEGGKKEGKKDHDEDKEKTIVCPSCGKKVKYDADKGPPKWCPHCCAGPGSVECAKCGYRWCGKKGPVPDKCPNCGAHDEPGSGGEGQENVPPADSPPPDDGSIQQDPDTSGDNGGFEE